MTNEVKKIREQIAKAKAEIHNTIMKHLLLLVESSEKTSSSGNKYISVDLYDHRVLELRDGELIFVNGDLTTYSIDNGDYELSDFEDIIRIETEGRDKERRYKVLLKQYDLAQEVIAKSGINIVTCGNCGSVNLHRLEDTEITCADCGLESEPCDFPDLFCV